MNNLIDGRKIKKMFREELERLFDRKITHIQYGDWDLENPDYIATYADLKSFEINRQEIITSQNDNFAVNFSFMGIEYTIDSLRIKEK